MFNAGPIRRFILAALVAGLALPLALHATTRTVRQKKLAALQQFDKAEQMREALTGRRAADRGKKDYQKVIDAYRRVYYLAPTSPKADDSVMAVAELLGESGRAFDDDKSFHDAIGQYEFLRKEYPGSRHRFEALFTIAQIYADDLNDAASARSAYQEFLKQYPHHRLAPDAQKALDDLAAEAAARKKGIKPPPKVKGKAKDKDNDQAPVEASLPADSAAAHPPHGRYPLVTGIRHWSTPDYTRVAVDLEDEVKYEAGRIPDPDRIFFDLHGTKLASELVGKTFDVEDGFLRKIRIGQYQVGETRLVLDVDDVSDYSAFLLPNPYRLIIDIHGRKPAQAVAKQAAPAFPPPDRTATPVPETTPVAKNEKPVVVPPPVTRAEQKKQEITEADGEKPAPAAEQKPTVELKATTKPTTAPTYEKVAPRETPKEENKVAKAREPVIEPEGSKAKPASNGERSLIRALGLKIGRIVVDAGHGGHDTGTIGPNGLQEKDLVLDVALRLGKLIENKMGAEVVYTRDDDTFIPLETRTAIANKEEADLFISIHANSSRDESARGVETYYLNFTSEPGALEVASRENAVSQQSIHELQDLVKQIALKEKIDESREFAGDVQTALYSGLSAKNKGLRNRGVKKAPFIVLIGANMPSILAEISFVSNPGDEKKLKTPDYRQKIAESLYKGISKYVSGLSGVKVANGNKPSLAKNDGQ